ncbi:MAG: DUF2442 domain-containing protein [Bacteroidota bacterium]
MNKQIGFSNSAPLIKSVRFHGQKIIIHLADGRLLLLPLNRFPEIERLTPAQKRKHKLLAGTGLMFDDLDTVFHVSDFLGKGSIPEFSLVAEPNERYGKERIQYEE